jgi:hypothetical protein
MMSALEHIYFSGWASKNQPGFTRSRKAYTQAKWDWRKHKRQLMATRWAREMALDPIIKVDSVCS